VDGKDGRDPGSASSPICGTARQSRRQSPFEGGLGFQYVQDQNGEFERLFPDHYLKPYDRRV